MAVGHIYYFLEDVLPNQPGRSRVLVTPMFLKLLCDPAPEDPNYQPLPEDRPGGFQWGGDNAGADGQGQDVQDRNPGEDRQPEEAPRNEAHPHND